MLNRFKGGVLCIFVLVYLKTGVFTVWSSEPRLEGCWYPDAQLSIQVAMPVLEKLSPEKASEVKRSFERYSFCFEKDMVILTSKGKDGEENVRTFQYRIFDENENERLLKVELVNASPTVSNNILSIGFIGSDRLWIDGVEGMMSFYDRKHRNESKPEKKDIETNRNTVPLDDSTSQSTHTPIPLNTPPLPQGITVP